MSERHHWESHTSLVVECDVNGQVAHGRGSRPVAVVLVPRDWSAVLSWLAEQLVVPESYRQLFFRRVDTGREEL